MTQRFFTPVQIMLHWLSAAVILWALCSGFVVAYFELPGATKGFISSLNVSLTTLLIPLFSLRMALAWRHRHRRVHAPGWPGRLARHAHHGLYAVTTLVLVTGVLMMDRAIQVFGVLSFPAPVAQLELLQLYHSIHLYACVVLAVMVVAHVGAVLMHQWQRTPVLRRMWF